MILLEQVRSGGELKQLKRASCTRCLELLELQEVFTMFLDLTMLAIKILQGF